ncbi:MAG: small nuclear ribonucleoprotein [Nanoarchaeota archaeon]|nr:small nuclear ribonucleoprotein [Nanoarchaeota archaeon]
METDRPLDALNAARNQRVLVELKNKLQIVGKLKAFDIHINTVLNDAEEHDESGGLKRKLGTVFIRGDMIVLISPA